MIQANFITYGGDITVQPPFQLDRPSMYCFWFKSDCNKLQKILDTRLNFANSGKRYVPFTSSIMLIFADTPHAYSGQSPDQGFISMNEAVFWILAVEQTQKNGKWVSERLVWFIPYIFVDNPMELIAGREVAGFPKALAEVIMSKNVHYANTFVINVPSYAKFGVNNEFVSNRLMSIERSSTLSARTSFGEELKDSTQAAAEMQNIFKNIWNEKGVCQGAINGITDIWHLFENLIADVRSLQMPAVFLKQFRSAGADGKACYQALVESAFAVNGFSGGWLLNAQEYSLNINHLDSFPVAEDLGLVSGQQPTHAIWVNVSFANTEGKEIWVAQ